MLPLFLLKFPKELLTLCSKAALHFQSAIKSYRDFLRTYPYGKTKATSYIQDFLEKSGRNDLVDKLELPQCELNVQSIERTLLE